MDENVGNRSVHEKAYRYSLREFAAFLVGISASFATGFVPAQVLGAYFYFVIIDTLLSGICSIVVMLLIKRFAISIGASFTIVAALGVFLQLPSEAQSFRVFLFLLGLLGFMPMLITIPLTIHRLTGSPAFEASNL